MFWAVTGGAHGLEFLAAPEGWRTPAPGYWMDEGGAENLWARIESTDNRAGKAEEAFRELDADYAGFRVKSREAYDRALEQWDAERAATDAEIRKLKRAANRWRFKPRFGFFLGPDFDFSEGKVGGIRFGAGIVFPVF